MKAEVLCIGTELLIGQTVNTNATWLGAKLAGLGASLLWVTTVGDNPGRMADALARACGRAELVIVTGGLGPTADDLTIEAIARLLGEPLVERPAVRAHVESVFAMRRRPITASDLKMALFPPSADPIPNPIGTACGLSVRHGGAWLMAFPGVPLELHAMWDTWAAPQVAATRGGTIRSVLLRYVGIGEAALAEQVADLLAGSNPSVAPYAGDGEVHLRVTAQAADATAADALMAPVLAHLRGLAPFYYGQDETTLPAAVGAQLEALGQTLSTGESCTGGLLASRLTDVAGASSWLRGGIVAYSAAAKAAALGVDPGLIAGGIVSEAVARAMAEGARARLGADWGVGITGWAGPGDGVPAGDEGLIWVAICGPDGTSAQDSRFGGFPRAAAKQRATQAALDQLRRRLASHAAAGA